MGTHIDQYHGIAKFGDAGKFWRRLPDEEFEHFALRHPDGHDNGYVYSTPPHTEDECDAWKFGPIVERKFS